MPKVLINRKDCTLEQLQNNKVRLVMHNEFKTTFEGDARHFLIERDVIVIRELQLLAGMQKVTK
jgi:hypothetical protein